MLIYNIMPLLQILNVRDTNPYFQSEQSKQADKCAQICVCHFNKETLQKHKGFMLLKASC